MVFTIGMVSRLELGKGQDTLIEAINILVKQFPYIKGVIVGEGDNQTKTNLNNLISKYKLGKNIKLVGYQKNLNKVMSKFDVQVFPTRWSLEGFGLVCLEAMLARIPLVVTNYGPVPEVVGNCAVLTEPRAEALAVGLVQIIQKPSLREKLVNKGYQRVCKLYNISKITTKYEELF